MKKNLNNILIIISNIVHNIHEMASKRNKKLVSSSLYSNLVNIFVHFKIKKNKNISIFLTRIDNFVKIKINNSRQ